MRGFTTTRMRRTFMERWHLLPWLVAVFILVYWYGQQNGRIQQIGARVLRRGGPGLEERLTQQLEQQQHHLSKVLEELKKLGSHVGMLEARINSLETNGVQQQQQQQQQEQQQQQAQTQGFTEADGGAGELGQCSAVYVSGAEPRADLNGLYDLHGRSDGHPVFVILVNNVPMYIYYVSAQGEWLVGSEVGSLQVHAYVQGGDVPLWTTGLTWNIAVSNNFVPLPNFKVVCVGQTREWDTVSVVAMSPSSTETTGTYRAEGPGGTFPTDVQWTLVTRRPRLFYLKGIFTEAECDGVVQLASSEMNRTMVVGQNGDGEVSNYRTNTGMFISRPEQVENPVVKSLRQKYAQFVGLPETNIEPINVLRYTTGQYYKPHTDWFPGDQPKLLARGGQRVASCLGWLTECVDGGPTAFPEVNITVHGHKGDAVCWFNVDENGKPDNAATHAAIPPEKGSTKWVAVGWVRANPFH